MDNYYASLFDGIRAHHFNGAPSQPERTGNGDDLEESQRLVQFREFQFLNVLIPSR